MTISIKKGRKCFHEIIRNLKIAYNLPNAPHCMYYVLMFYDHDVISYFLTRLGYISDWEKNLQRYVGSYRQEEEQKNFLYKIFTQLNKFLEYETDFSQYLFINIDGNYFDVSYQNNENWYNTVFETIKFFSEIQPHHYLQINTRKLKNIRTEELIEESNVLKICNSIDVELQVKRVKFANRRLFNIN